MLAIKSRVLVLVLCFLVAALLLTAQVLGNSIAIFLCLGCFLTLVVGAAIKGFAIPIFLFFLPFAPLIKIQPGTISFYTIALLAVYMIYLVMGSRNINVLHFIPGLILIALLLVVKTLRGYEISDYFILFALSLLLVPFFARELDEKYDFYWLTMFFSLGIIFAAISAQYLSVFPAIRKYIQTISQFGSVRHSGYYGDPNFYSAHITVALGGVLVLLIDKISKLKSFLLLLVAGTLLYCGLQSISKSFILVAACLFVLWLIAVMFSKGKISAKLMIIAIFVLGILFLQSSTVFSDMVEVMLSRFKGNNSWSDLTTGRTDIWTNYMKALSDDPTLLLFGQGFTSKLVNGRNSHNTIIQMVYQFGLIGSTFMIAWIACFVKTLLSGVKVRIESVPKIFILLLGAFGPWMALDLAFFDEFFLVPIYVCVGIKFLDGYRISNND